jgi:hypothetical protein
VAGYDTIPLELIKEMWGAVETDYTTLIKEDCDSGHLEGSMKFGITFLISKGVTMSLLKNYRPILVLSASYKIIAKTLTNRL